ncbi:MAG TPA: SDR family NAD(P)-dependent oxidoreductase [Propionibacteriaceae bacterium]
MTDLAGKHLLVVGATGGLGSAICRELARSGARLTLAGRAADRLAALTTELGDSVVGTVDADLADPAAPTRLAAVADEQPIDGLVLAAGVVAFGPLTELDDDDLDQLFLVNVLGPIRVIRDLLPRLASGAVVVSLSAVVAENPTAGMAAYSATKAALTGFDRAIALELRRAGVRVLDVRPPHTETGLATRPIAGDPPRLPTGKSPDDVARRIVQAITDDEKDLPSSGF